ncbi:MAG: carbohydrate ABC transporter permease [Oscillospiraceae bacterium]|nr:carbohydrate ABC transporter permease [Oscillospiraceae bacterium]
MTSLIKHEHGEHKRTVPVRGKSVLKLASIFLLILALLVFAFGISGLLGADITGTIFLEATIADAMAIPSTVEVMDPVTGESSPEPIWTPESWEELQGALRRARILAADGAETQIEIDTVANELEASIYALELVEEHADEDKAMLLPSGRAIDTYFIFALVYGAFMLVSGVFSFIGSTDRKKAYLLSILGVVGIIFTLAFFFFTASTLGYTLAWSTIAIIAIPLLLTIGSRINNRKVDTVIYFGILSVLSVIVLFPMWWIIRSSLMTLTEVGSMAFFPNRWLFENYRNALERFHFFLYLRNTMIIAVPAVVLGTGTAVLCGYSFARLRFRGKKFVFGLCIASMLLPPMVTLIPIFIVWTSFLGVTNSFLPLIIPWICGGGAFNIFLMRQFMLTIPRELDEAAMIDGAGRLRILWFIIFPAVKPAIMVVAIFIFMLIWNDLLTQMIYLGGDQSMATMAIGLRVFSGSFGTVWNYTMVAAVLAIIPGVIIYIIGQKYLVEGIVMTGMKN